MSRTDKYEGIIVPVTRMGAFPDETGEMTIEAPVDLHSIVGTEHLFQRRADAIKAYKRMEAEKRQQRAQIVKPMIRATLLIAGVAVRQPPYRRELIESQMHQICEVLEIGTDVDVIEKFRAARNEMEASDDA
jgi:hypothetical protein